MQQTPYGPPPAWNQPPAVRATAGPAVVALLAIIALFLGGLLAVTLYDARSSHITRQTHNAVQDAFMHSNNTLTSIDSDFSKSVFNTATTDSAPKQTVAELEYIFEMQRVLADQNQAMLLALLNG